MFFKLGKAKHQYRYTLNSEETMHSQIHPIKGTYPLSTSELHQISAASWENKS